jgi:hypothetical protein
MPSISNEEFYKISRDMEVYHGVFSQLWKMGKPRLDENLKYKTACVGFNDEGRCIDFVFHPEYWKESSDVKKHFTICHESLHVMFGHGKRGKGLDRDLANVAMDVVINECLVSQFGFDREEIAPLKPDGKRDFCWLDNVFPDGDAEPNRSFEYYYDLLVKKSKNGGFSKKGLPKLVDSHDGLEGITDKLEKEIQDEICDSLSEEELESLSKKLSDDKEDGDKKDEKESKGGGRSNIAGNLKKRILLVKVKKKRKWETIIRKWASKFVTNSSRDMEQWAISERRLNMLPKDMFIPSEYEVEDRAEEVKKIEVWFFQDVSGSCSHLIERFYKAAKSLPKNRFSVRMHCFDTSVHRVDLDKNEVMGNGWGTRFDIIETYIQQRMKEENLPYPKAVFVVTDGIGNHVTPQIPKKWFWFLSMNYLNCIPNECNIFKLEDFE